jgi:hypothetical protein
MLGGLLIALTLLSAVGLLMTATVVNNTTLLLISGGSVFVMYFVPSMLCFWFANAADDSKRWAFVAMLVLGAVLAALFLLSVVGQFMQPAASAPGLITAALVIMMSAVVMLYAKSALRVLARASARIAPAFDVGPAAR